MKSDEIREKFIKFFEERNHRVVPSSSLIPDDPTLLLTNAGMVQFKPYFLREVEPPFPRATSVQKCLRTTDIDSVGKTARHNTFFEMLGNFSFGDYYKESAIPWAWELVTSLLEIDADRLWVSIFNEDDEAEAIWAETLEERASRIVKLGEKDNFWDMGPTGPCGPCSEILYDRGLEYACSDSCAPGCDCDRFVELWNLVFMQYNREPDGSLRPLPRKNIDTGMGLERAAAIKQGVKTIFETDTFLPLLDSIAEISGVRLSDSESSDVSIKVIADHCRAATFLISDGVIPSNEGRGYVLRRLIRRAVRHGRIIGIDIPFLHSLSLVVVQTYGNTYRELTTHSELISEVIKVEEERFGQTLEQGLELLYEEIEVAKGGGKHLIDGKTAFYLHDTLGFPLELTEEIAQDSGMQVDVDGFEKLMEEQKHRARSKREEEAQDRRISSYISVFKERGQTIYEGYEKASLTARVEALILDGERIEKASGDFEVDIILDRTPFYAESGGQIGDTGSITSRSAKVTVLDTFYGAPGLVVHRGKLEGMISVGDEVQAIIDINRRMNISRNHTATHILHWALREVLGAHVRQAGSLVEPDRLRFDFTHFKPLSDGELELVENLANGKVLEDRPVCAFNTSREEAMRSGAIALFGEKYAEEVRVVEIEDFSRELCGGVHVERTGQIGLIKIVSESSIGAGLRRIEAVTGVRSLERLRKFERIARETGVLLRCQPEEIPEKTSEALLRMRELERSLQQVSGRALEESCREISENGIKETIAGIRVISGGVSGLDQKKLREAADILVEKEGYGAVAVGSLDGQKAHLVVKLSSSALDKGLDARELAKAGGLILGGGGGGRADMAVAGGSRVESIEEALQAVSKVIRKKLESQNPNEDSIKTG